MELPDYTTFITGQSKGLGEQLALSLQGNSYVVGVSRTKSDALYCPQVCFDITRLPYNTTEFGYEVLGETKLNLVLCAGVLGKPVGIETVTIQDWMNVFGVNLFGNIAVLQALLPQMKKTQYGRVVFLAGGGSAYGYPLFTPYALSKVAIVREVENIAIEMKDKIKDFSIIALAPGAMETEMLEKVREAGAEVKTTVDIQEPVEFIKKFLGMSRKEAVKLSGKFIHVRDDLSSRNKKNKWLLRRIE